MTTGGRTVTTGVGDPTAADPVVPWLPEGSLVTMPGGAELFVRDSARDSGRGADGAADRPTLVLLHGWMATADLNFGFAAKALAEGFRVVSFDHRGHGRGLATGGRFGFDRCADDVADVLDALGIAHATAVGYSMGGPVAVRFAQRHPDRADGLVLCATALRFSRSPLVRAALAPVGALVDVTGLIPGSLLRDAARKRVIGRRATGRYAGWIADQLALSDPTALAQAGVALGRLDAHDWCAGVDAQVASVVTVDDQLVAPAAQRALAREFAHARVFEVTGGHTTCFDHPEVFTPVLVDACRSVTGG